MMRTARCQDEAASTVGAYFLRRALFLFAVLREDFFAADLLFAFARFAMLPS
jgi:hypothetical protein